MAEQISASGYSLTAIQITPGIFEGQFEIFVEGSTVLLAIHCNVGVRFIGLRNTNFTCISTIAQGSGGWRTMALPHPWLAGFNTAEASCCFWLDSDTTFLCTLLQKDTLLQSVSSHTLEILQHCNVAYPDLYRHKQWEAEFINRFAGNKPDKCFFELTDQIFETAEFKTVPVTTDAQVSIIKKLPEFLTRLINGENISVKQAADEFFLSQSGFKNIILDITGLTPKQLITNTKTEGVLQMLREPLRRRSCGVSDTLMSIATFYSWSEASARKNLRDLTRQMPASLLVKH